MELSLIIPVYNEEKNLQRLHMHIISTLKSAGIKDYEIIFVDDGSTDYTYDIISTLQKNNKRIRLVKFQRNFGKSAALDAGFIKCEGDVVVTLDGDLQDDPREIPRFIKKVNQGYDLVSGWKAKRKDPLSKTIPSKLFNHLAKVLTKVKIHDFNCGFKAYRKPVVKNLRLYGEHHRYIPALAAMKGFSVGEIRVRHHKRKYGKSKYGFSRLFKGMFDMMTISFFMKYARSPLHFFGILGMLSFIFGFFGGMYLILIKLMGQNIGNRPALWLVTLLLVIGTQFISLGLLAELIIQNRQDKHYVIEEST